MAMHPLGKVPCLANSDGLYLAESEVRKPVWFPSQPEA